MIAGSFGVLGVTLISAASKKYLSAIMVYTDSLPCSNDSWQFWCVRSDFNICCVKEVLVCHYGVYRQLTLQQ